MMDKRGCLIDIFNSALKTVDPYNAMIERVKVVGNIMTINGQDYDLDNFNRIVVVGAGKATAPMVQAIEKNLGERVNGGIIIVKYGHTRSLRKIRQVEASHPIPDEAGLKGTEGIVEMLKEADEKTLVVCLISGGGSSLLVSPADDITFNDKQEVTDLLLKSGATIDELNTVRKHISNIKGGKLAQIVYPATIVTLILSDVIGDRLDVIASGPTVPDNTTFQDAIGVIEKYGLEDKLPTTVLRFLKQGLNGKIGDTPKAGEVFFENARTIVIGSIKQVLNAAMEKASTMGFEPEIVTSELQGEARNAARYLAERAVEVQKSLKSGERSRCLISGGETTVTVKGKGLGGRNQELALAFAIEIEGMKGIMMLSAGTDGTDGPTDAAGAIVDGETVPLARKFSLDPLVYLEDNDSYNFFKRLDSLSKEKYHLITGPTGTNVMDMQIIIAER